MPAPQQFAPKTLEDLITHWEQMVHEYSVAYQENDRLGLTIHAQQAYGRMMGLRTAINHARITLANA
jgi:hypothetical protein